MVHRPCTSVVKHFPNVSRSLAPSLLHSNLFAFLFRSSIHREGGLPWLLLLAIGLHSYSVLAHFLSSILAMFSFHFLVICGMISSTPESRRVSSLLYRSFKVRSIIDLSSCLCVTLRFSVVFLVRVRTGHIYWLNVFRFKQTS